MGTKSAVQIRSHAQKFFAKHGTGEGGQPTTVVVPGADGGTESISIPPPRPKRKPSQPLPRKAPPPGIQPSNQPSIHPSTAPLPPPAAAPQGDQAVLMEPVNGHKRGPPAPVAAPFPKARRSGPGGNSVGGQLASPAPSGGTTAAGGTVTGRNTSRREPPSAAAPASRRSAIVKWPIGGAQATHAPPGMLLGASTLFGGLPGGQEGGGVGTHAHADGGFGPHIMQFMAHQQHAFAAAAALAAGAAAAAHRAVTTVAPVGGSPDHTGSGGAATDAADGGCLVPAPPPLEPLDTAAMAAWAAAAAYGPGGGHFYVPQTHSAHQPMGPPLGFGDVHAGSLRGAPLLVNFAMEGKGYSRNGGPQADTDGAEGRDGPTPPGGSGGTSSSGAQSGQDGKGQPPGEVAAGGGADGAAGGGLNQPNGNSEDEVEGLRGVPPTDRAFAAASGPQAPTLLGPPTAHPHRSAQGHALAKHQAVQAARLAAATAAATEQQQQQAHLVIAAMQHAQHHGAAGGEQTAQAQPRLLPVASPSSAFSTFNRMPSARSLSGAAVATGSGSVGGRPAATGLGQSRHLAAGAADPALLFAAGLGPTDAAAAALWQHHAAAASAMAQWTRAAAVLWGAAPTPAGFAAFQPPLHAVQHGAAGGSQRHGQHLEPATVRVADVGAAAQPHAAAVHAPRPATVAAVAVAVAAADGNAQPESEDAATAAQPLPPPSAGPVATTAVDKEAGSLAVAHAAAGASDADAAAAHPQQLLQPQHVRRAVSPGSSSGDEPTVRHGHTNARVTAADEAVAAQERRERGTGDVSGGDNSGGDETGNGGSGDGQGTNNRGSNGGTGNRSSSGDGGSREGSEQKGDRLACKGEGGTPHPGAEAVTFTDRQ